MSPPSPLVPVPMLLVLVSASVASAEFRTTPVETRILTFLDRDSDGLLSSTEVANLPTPMRRWIDDNGVDLVPERPLTLDEFARTLRPMLEDLREGRFSTPSRRRPSIVEEREVPRTVTRRKPTVDAEAVRTAEYIFRQMDRNRDGKLDYGEWRRSQSVRPWFEDEGIRFPGEMSRSEFVDHMARISSALGDED